jgi:hypothetical protein
VRKQEDELMGLYAIAREEMDGVHEACEKLHGVIKRLDNVTSHIQHNAKNGLESSLSDFNRQVDANLRERVENAVIGLKNASSDAINSLRKQEKLYWAIFFMIGVIVGMAVVFFWFLNHLTQVEAIQELTYKEVLALKPKLHKAKPKIHRKAASQKEEDSETTDSEEQSQ